MVNYEIIRLCSICKYKTLDPVGEHMKKKVLGAHVYWCL